jgi:hypothetical protein
VLAKPSPNIDLKKMPEENEREIGYEGTALVVGKVSNQLVTTI